MHSSKLFCSLCVCLGKFLLGKIIKCIMLASYRLPLCFEEIACYFKPPSLSTLSIVSMAREHVRRGVQCLPEDLWWLMANSQESPRVPHSPDTSLLPMNAPSVTSRLGVTSVSECGGWHRKWRLRQPGTSFPPLSDILVHLFFVNKINSVFSRRV